MRNNLPFDGLIPDCPTQGWQPIESAPKDGTRVLGFVGRWVIVRWAVRFSEHYGDTSGGWYDGEIDGRAFPTHWMPLPAPPAEQGGEQK